jgi:hypothetical protein
MFKKNMTNGKRGNGFQHGYVQQLISAGDEAIPPSRFYLHRSLRSCMQNYREIVKYLEDLKQKRLFQRFDGGCCFLNGFFWANEVNGIWQNNLDLYAWNFGDEWKDDPAIIPWNVHGEQKLMGGRDLWASDALNLASQYLILRREEEHRRKNHIESLAQFLRCPPKIHGVIGVITDNI